MGYFSSKRHRMLAVFALALGWGHARARTYRVLHGFPQFDDDGAFPHSMLTTDGTGRLYGTTYVGGSHGVGTVYVVREDGSEYSILHSFDLPQGGYPQASVVLDGEGNLYGTTHDGGTESAGTVYRMRDDGTGYVVLRSFSVSVDGGFPYGALIVDASGNLLGTTSTGGTGGSGTVFTMKLDGSGFNVLHAFGNASDGGFLVGPLALDESNRLYGTTSFGCGTVFTLRTDGTEFRTLHALTCEPNDGRNPVGVLLDGSGSLFITTSDGGFNSTGAIVTLKTDGSAYSVLYSFGILSPTSAVLPTAALIIDAEGNLYGVTAGGGTNGKGTVFSIKRDGTGFSILHSFGGNSSDGAGPPRGSFVTDRFGALYGTAVEAGPGGGGVVFKLDAPVHFIPVPVPPAVPVDGRWR